MSRWMRSPFLWASAAGMAVLGVAFVPVLWMSLRGGPAAPPATTRAGAELPPPWQIERGAQGELLAFGLRLPGSTLADAQRRWGGELQVALIESRGGATALEAYVERWQGGGVTGRLVLASDAAPDDVKRWRERAVQRETLDADAQRWILAAEDLAAALRSAVSGASFLPASRLDESTLQARFGVPAERWRTADGTEHALYPERGLAVAWQPQRGKAVLQVVALPEVERVLRQPLRAAGTRVDAAASAPAR